MRDHAPDYDAARAVVLGISRDPVERLAAWDAELRLGFPLSDADHAVAEAYGVWVEKSMYGRHYMGTQRATFVVDPDGVVAHVIPKASPKTHDEQVLAALERIETF